MRNSEQITSQNALLAPADNSPYSMIYGCALCSPTHEESCLYQSECTFEQAVCNAAVAIGRYRRKDKKSDMDWKKECALPDFASSAVLDTEMGWPTTDSLSLKFTSEAGSRKTCLPNFISCLPLFHFSGRCLSDVPFVPNFVH
eukprot:1269802-Amphidinium_carterae.1